VIGEEKMPIKKWSIKIVNILFITFLLLCFYFIASSKLTGTIPQIGGYQVVSVLTGSMNPTIQSGSLILVKKVNAPQTIQVNDIITFQSSMNPDQLITHRIVEIEKANGELYLSTKGDSNRTADARSISVNEVFGKYQNFHIPYVGYILQFTQTKTGFILFFLIPALLLVLSSLDSFRYARIHKRTVSGGNQ
jgi:signal peptidase I